SGEDTERRASGRLGCVFDLKVETEIGFVRAEAPIGFGVRHAWERRFELDSDATPPDRRDHRLHQLQEKLLVRERHLDIQLRYLLHAIGTEVFIAEADGNLVVALEARD